MREILFSLFGLKPIVVDYVDKDRVSLPIGYDWLYGFKVVSNVEVVKTISADTVKKLYYLHSSEPDKILFQVFKRDFDGVYNYDHLYYLSWNRNLLQILAESFGFKNIKFLSGLELTNLLLNLVKLTPELEVRNYERLEVGKRFREVDLPVVRRAFYSAVKDVDWENYYVHAGVGHIGKVVRVERLFEVQWSGVFYQVFNFNDPGLFLESKKSRVLKDLKVFEEMLQDSKEGKRQFIRVYALLVSKDKRTSELAPEIMYSMGWTAVPVENGKALHVLCTPLLVREADWEFLFTPEGVKDMIFYSFAKTDYPEVGEVEGRNRHGVYVSFSFFEENDNPHCMVFAPSGAGKSFNMQNMVVHILRLDTTKLYHGEPQDMRKDVRIRYFDKGFSAELLFKLMKERGLDVGLFSASPDEIVLNPCEVYANSTEEYDFSLYVVNACLTAIEIPPLTGYEAVYYREALRKVYTTGNKSIEERSIEFLADVPAHRETYEKLIKKGYSPRQKIKEVKDPEFYNLHQPLLHDVHRELMSKVKDVVLSTEQKKAVESALGKIGMLLKENPLIYPTQVPIRHNRIVYMDFEHLSRSRFFVPIVLVLLKRLTMIDKFEKPEGEKAYYVIDEAHNMLRDENFRLALEILIREARKYRISMVFLTQNYSEVNPVFITNSDTIMFISPQEESARRAYFTGFLNHIGGLGGADDLERVYFSSPARTFTVKYSRGVFTLKLDVDEVKKALFDSYARSLRTPDGKFIEKSMVLHA